MKRQPTLAQQIKKELKVAFPKLKVSCTQSSVSTVYLDLLNLHSTPYNYNQINDFCQKKYAKSDTCPIANDTIYYTIVLVKNDMSEDFRAELLTMFKNYYNSEVSNENKIDEKSEYFCSIDLIDGYGEEWNKLWGNECYCNLSDRPAICNDTEIKTVATEPEVIQEKINDETRSLTVANNNELNNNRDDLIVNIYSDDWTCSYHIPVYLKLTDDELKKLENYYAINIQPKGSRTFKEIKKVKKGGFMVIVHYTAMNMGGEEKLEWHMHERDFNAILQSEPKIIEVETEVNLVPTQQEIKEEIKATKKEIAKISKLINYLESNNIYGEIYDLTQSNLDELNRKLSNLESQLDPTVEIKKAIEVKTDELNCLSVWLTEAVAKMELTAVNEIQQDIAKVVQEIQLLQQQLNSNSNVVRLFG